MSDLNHGAFNGRIAKKEVRTFGEGKIVNINLAVNYYDRKEKKQSPLFVKTSVFGQLAEYFAKHADVGDLIHLQGEWRPNIYTSKAGEKHSELRLSVEKGSLLCKKGAGGTQASAVAATSSTPSADKEKESSTDGFYPMDEELEEDDLPF